MGGKDILNIISTAIIALVTPFLLMLIVFPVGQMFLPNENIVLTPGIRMVCTSIMAIIDYAIVYMFIKDVLIQKGIIIHLFFFFLIFMWSILVGIIWYLFI